eukprot:CAMPEP_0205933492 /NCGR_PEP_ID=MMETSP1325-20131115/33287_1 /ASSEMBLY_ACC=CAM_ASM_000708 /TAXON_ID=236786 /ORGANISM="Florenciella sp., Strain RCC1007" /LENGTH=40 /DNA_ID= /DNA_START= /DNA_END= /DNA_ORIENTATION=
MDADDIDATLVPTDTEDTVVDSDGLTPSGSGPGSGAAAAP